jgi:hypothetical protein
MTIARALENYSPDRARDAFREATALPLGTYESLLVRTLLSRLVYDGQFALANDLVEGATGIKPSPNSGQSPAGMRLDWSRHVRRESAQRPFYHRIRDILVRHCEPSAADAKNFRRLTWPLSAYALNHEDRAKAIAAAFKGNLFTVSAPSELIDLLASATSFNARHRDLGPELEAAILTASEIDEGTRGQWLDSAGGISDFDTPAIAGTLDRAYRAHLSRTDLPASAPSRRVVRMRQAFLALRTSGDERPEALFGTHATKDIDANLLRLLQFSFLSSRTHSDDALALMQQIDADRLATINVYPHAAQLLQATHNETELALLKTAAIDQLQLKLPSLWMETKPHSILVASIAAEWLEMSVLMSAEFFARALAQQADDFDRDLIRLAHASLEDNWTAQRNAASAILKSVPDYYEAFYFRGEASLKLNDPKGARHDLELYLEKALESPLRPHARQMLQTLPH